MSIKNKIVLILITFLNCSNLFAATTYVEGNINYTEVDNVDTTTYSFSAAGNNYVGKLINNYDSDYGYGFEIGITDLSINDNLRLGLSYQKNEIELDRMTVTGTENGVAGQFDLTSADLSAAGLDFDNEVKSYSINAYYDFQNTNGLIPFVGIGLGQVDIENAKDDEMSKSIYLGGKYFTSDQMYFGIKGSYTEIDGPEDKLGLTYEDITVKSVSFNIGYQF